MDQRIVSSNLLETIIFWYPFSFLAAKKAANSKFCIIYYSNTPPVSWQRRQALDKAPSFVAILPEP